MIDLQIIFQFYLLIYVVCFSMYIVYTIIFVFLFSAYFFVFFSLKMLFLSLLSWQIQHRSSSQNSNSNNNNSRNSNSYLSLAADFQEHVLPSSTWPWDFMILTALNAFSPYICTQGPRKGTVQWDIRPPVTFIIWI